jgi:fatty-acyl-CoA synthase
MMNTQLLISDILTFAERFHGGQEIVTRTVEGPIHRYRYTDLASRTRKLANALKALGVGHGDRVATIGWNTHRHMEAFYAISGFGAVCHTMNPRLSPDNMAFVVNDAKDKVVLFDLTFAPLIEPLAGRSPSVKHWVAMTDADHVPENGLEIQAYEDLLDGADDELDWPRFDENEPSGLCYTSGTTGKPRGVFYTNRSTVLHAYATAMPDAFGFTACDVVLPVVPMFHVNAWGIPYTALMAGVKLVMPGPGLDGASLTELLVSEDVTFAAGVPTIWHNLLAHLRETGTRLDSVDRMIVGGSAVPPSMIDAFKKEHGTTIIHAWGMTELSPVGSVCSLKPGMEDLPPDELMKIKSKQGRGVFGIEWRLVDDAGDDLPWDGESVGELLVRGPWVADDYLGIDSSEVLRDGWFPTGDIATVDAEGYLQITDRTRDIIKSGGEWISSIELENTAVGHPGVAQAAAIGVSDDRWGERPLLFIVPSGDQPPEIEDLKQFIGKAVPKWWVPDRFEIVDGLPLGATGKVLKRELRKLVVQEE